MALTTSHKFSTCLFYFYFLSDSQIFWSLYMFKNYQRCKQFLFAWIVFIGIYSIQNLNWDLKIINSFKNNRETYCIIIVFKEKELLPKAKNFGRKVLQFCKYLLTSGLIEDSWILLSVSLLSALWYAVLAKTFEQNLASGWCLGCCLVVGK